LITALATCGFAWAALAWWQLSDWPPQPDPGRISANECLTYERLQLLAAAQERFRAEDRDGDGEKSYAQFLVHLWRTVDVEGRPVPVELVSKRLGFAMEPSRAIDGYYYVDLRERRVGPERRETLDPRREWAVLALPELPGKTGRLCFLIDSSAKIYAREESGSWRRDCPADPAGAGWTELPGVDDLRKLQRRRQSSSVTPFVVPGGK
jgi:hypothetical protein